MYKRICTMKMWQNECLCAIHSTKSTQFCVYVCDPKRSKISSIFTVVPCVVPWCCYFDYLPISSFITFTCRRRCTYCCVCITSVNMFSISSVYRQVHQHKLNVSFFLGFHQQRKNALAPQIILNNVPHFMVFHNQLDKNCMKTAKCIQKLHSNLCIWRSYTIK